MRNTDSLPLFTPARLHSVIEDPHCPLRRPAQTDSYSRKRRPTPSISGASTPTTVGANRDKAVTGVTNREPAPLQRPPPR